MNNLVVCPACEGRGAYCLHLDDGGWSELVILDVPCDMCDGKRVVRDDSVQFDFSEVPPAYPYVEID